MNSTDATRPENCPSCGRLNDAFAHVPMRRDERATPDIGDHTVCLYCGALLVITEEWRLREMTLTEITTMRGTEPAYYHHLMNAKDFVDYCRKEKAPDWARRFLP